MLRVTQLKVPAGAPEKDIEDRIRKILRLRPDAAFSWSVEKHSLDARKKPDIFDVYTVRVSLESGERKCAARAGKNVSVFEPGTYRFAGPSFPEGAAPMRPAVVGFGPAGIFSALEMAKHGLKPVVFERGAPMEERVADVDGFFGGGRLRPESNVQFGEGGAGTFSDGKLSTGVRDPKGRNAYVLDTFVGAGAPPEIAYEQYPHIGTDKLRTVIVNLRKQLEALGGEVRFHSKVTEILSGDGRVTGVRVLEGGEPGTGGKGREYVYGTGVVVLAPGHSARDTFRMLLGRGVPLVRKDFAVGFRVSHPQSMIDIRQYGSSGTYPPASYRLATKAASGRGVYSFCMCPGGYIVNASSEPGRLAVNGMSDYDRNSPRANSAVIMTVGEKDFGAGGPLAGLEYQERLEERAFTLAGGRIPVERYTEFRERFRGGSTFSPGEMTAGEAALLCLKGPASRAPLHELLPAGLTGDFIEGMEIFENSYPGFTGPEAYVCGLESRTSSPVRILRNEMMESDLPGLIPCGEGAGYAGGIMSAAIDGLKAAEAAARIAANSGHGSGSSLNP